MKGHSQRANAITIAMTALCMLWLLISAIVTVPAFAEGGNPGLPSDSLPADTTIITGCVVTPEGGMTTADVFETVVLFLEAVL